MRDVTLYKWLNWHTKGRMNINDIYQKSNITLYK